MPKARKPRGADKEGMVDIEVNGYYRPLPGRPLPLLRHCAWTKKHTHDMFAGSVAVNGLLFRRQNIDPDAAFNAKAAASDSVATSGRMDADMQKACQQLDIEGAQPPRARASALRTTFWVTSNLAAQWTRDAIA